MNRIVLIGNGFDMAHGLKTSYMDFINWYWAKRIKNLNGNLSRVSEDCLCKLTIKDNTNINCWNAIFYGNSYFKNIESDSYDIIKELQNKPEYFTVDCSQFFDTILRSIDTKGWVDIENDYYLLLKRCSANVHCGYTAKELNEQFAFLREKLIEYLGTIGPCEPIKDLEDALIDYFDPADFSIEGKKKAMDNIGLDINNYKRECQDFLNQQRLLPKQIMLLSFNYTPTAKMYNYSKIKYNYIHGELERPKNIIFGYGDELDNEYQGILAKNDNELLKNIKSVKYLETKNYHDMLEFLMSAPFQVFIMGHSCGNSDRTLLNTLFEHENCVSIKPFYHKLPDGNDNYMEIVQNISRNFNFTNMCLYRDRVVNKEQCKTM